MTNYEQMFSSISLKGNIHWDELDDFIILAYAAVLFKKIADNEHDYQKEPLLIYRQLFHPTSFSSHEPINTYFISPSTYFSNLLCQTPFFQRLHGNQVLHNTSKKQLNYAHEFTDIKNAQDAYYFLKERYPNDVYVEEVEEIFQLAQPYCDIMIETRKLDAIISKSSNQTCVKNKI
jgi:hypothetical protein